ncbi:MAG TPA: hypothetical protein VGM03_14930 [Phycisphaerae bacterium]|jgi:hypothetical protein
MMQVGTPAPQVELPPSCGAAAVQGATEMFQVCIFGGYEGRLLPTKRVLITLFAGAELHRPTLARRLLACRQRQVEGRAHRVFVLTIFGSTEMRYPTLAEEFLDMREAVRSGALSLTDWDALLGDLRRLEAAGTGGREPQEVWGGRALSDDEGIVSLTLFGSLEETSLPSEDAEVDALAVQRHLGNIPESAGKVLEFGIGQPEAARRAILRQAIAAA